MKTKELLQQCNIQLQYLNDRFGELPTTRSMMKRIEHHINELDASQFQQEWIPVEKGLPKCGVPVLIITDYGMQDVCHLSFSETGTLWINHMRQQHSNGGVIAWQPLPQPYNPKQP